MTLIPDRIRWYEDVLVTPQHVEQLSRRLELLVQGLPARYSPFAWGVAHAHVVLHDGVIGVTALDAVMPNGLQVAFEDDGMRLQLDLRAHVPSAGRARVLVHLALPREDSEDASVRRFVAGSIDEMLGDDGLPLERRRSRLTLCAGEAPSPARYVSLPLREVTVDGAAITLTDFVPPLLHVAPGDVIAQRCAEVVDRLRREVAVLANRSMDDAPMPFRAEVRAQINPVIAALPPFEVLATASPHPFALYLELCRVAAAAAALRDRVAPPSFPPYNHADLRGVFDPLFRFVLGSTQASLSESTASFAFERDGVWFRLPPEQGWSEALAAGSPQQLVLAMQAETSDAQAAHWGEHCVIASRSAIQPLLARRVLGLGRRRIHAIGALPVERDVHLFRLDVDPALVKPGEDLLVLGDLPGIRPAALTLHVINAAPER